MGEYTRVVSSAHRFSTREPEGRPGLRAWGRAFGVASLVHLTLPDVQAPGWLIPALMEGVGALWLLHRPAAGAFALCAVGTALPLLFLRDVLTQSMYLTWAASLGFVGALGKGGDVRGAVRLLTASAYAVAALHKLNTDFFDPGVSCANHAVAQVSARWPWAEPLAALDGALPFLVLGLELALAWLVLRGSPWMWLWGLVFHLPLTVTLAPAFGPVMFSGYVAATRTRDAAIARDIWRRHKGRLCLGGLLLVATDGLSIGELEGPVLIAKLFVAGAIAAGALSLVGRPARAAAPRSSLGAKLVAVGWLLHGLTPYLGLQYQHTGAMLSNLRVDVACHNSVVFPSSLMATDPYLHIDSARIGRGQRAARERVLEASLWNIAALHTMQRNWCVPELRPIQLKGSWRGRAFEIADLCDDDWLDALPGARWLPAGFQRFQKNLGQACHAACIH
jgi:hypothetical protein